MIPESQDSKHVSYKLQLLMLAFQWDVNELYSLHNSPIKHTHTHTHRFHNISEERKSGLLTHLTKNLA